MNTLIINIYGILGPGGHFPIDFLFYRKSLEKIKEDLAVLLPDVRLVICFFPSFCLDGTIIFESKGSIPLGKSAELIMRKDVQSIITKHLKWEIDNRNCKKNVIFVTTGLCQFKPLIDCNTSPFVPDGWKVVEHQKSGILEFDASKVKCYRSKKQGSTVVGIKGNKLQEELRGKKVLNANVLDYLLEKPFLIPNEWKQSENGNNRLTYFWGTIYRHRGELCVRYLSFNYENSKWQWSFNFLYSIFSYSELAGVLSE